MIDFLYHYEDRIRGFNLMMMLLGLVFGLWKICLPFLLLDFALGPLFGYVHRRREGKFGE